MQSTAQCQLMVHYYHTLRPGVHRPTLIDSEPGRTPRPLPAPWPALRSQSGTGRPPYILRRLERHILVDFQKIVAVEFDLGGADHAVHLLSVADADDGPGDRRIP